MSRSITQLPPGVGVWLYETVSGTAAPAAYIYLGTDESGSAILLRKHCVAQKRMNSANIASYNGSEMDQYLENSATGFLSRFDADTLAALRSTTIKYTDYNQSPDGAAQVLSVARRCFLPSFYEMGLGGNEGGRDYLSALKAYYNTTSDNAARTPSQENGTNVSAWLRSAKTNTLFLCVSSTGVQVSYQATNANYWFRPALSVAPTTTVSDEGSEEIFLLPDSHRSFWPLCFTASLGRTAGKPKCGKLFLPNTLGAGDLLDCQVCSNYADPEPNWLPCKNDKIVCFENDKTGPYWEIGVKVEAQCVSPGRMVYEPAMIVALEADT